MTHICISKLTNIGSDNVLSPGRHQAIIWTNAGLLLIGPSGKNVSDILIEIHTFSFKKMHWKMSSGKWRPFRFNLNVFTHLGLSQVFWSLEAILKMKELVVKISIVRYFEPAVIDTKSLKFHHLMFLCVWMRCLSMFWCAHGFTFEAVYQDHIFRFSMCITRQLQ